MITRKFVLWLLIVISCSLVVYSQTPTPTATPTKSVKKPKSNVEPVKELKDGALIHIEASISKTAFLVGDKLILRLRISYPDNIAIIDEDIDPTKINLAPFDVKSVSITDSRFGELMVKTCDYELKSLELKKTDRTIQSFVIHYAKLEPGKSVDQLKKIEYKLEKIPIEWRTTLPNDVSDIRDDVEIKHSGILGIALIVAGVAVLILMVLWRLFKTAKDLSSPKVVKPRKVFLPGIYIGSARAILKLTWLFVWLKLFQKKSSKIQWRVYETIRRFMFKSVLKTNTSKTPQEILGELLSNKRRNFYKNLTKKLVVICEDMEKHLYKDEDVPELSKVITGAVVLLIQFNPLAIIRHPIEFWSRGR